MANVLNNLIPDVYAALDVVSRELVGMIPAVQRDATAERAAVGQVVRSPVTPVATAIDLTPAMQVPTPADQTIANTSLTITKSRSAPFAWNGEQTRGLNNNGPGQLTIQQDQIAQALRTLTNEVEADLTALHIATSRAYGTAGTTPFATDLSDTAQVRKILDDNGAPASDRHLIIDTTAGAKMRTLTQLTKANEANDATMLRQGVLLDVHNFAIRESAQIKTSTAGTAAGATTTNAGFAVGATAIALASAGTGAIVAGDIITFAGDTNKYVVAAGDTDVSNGGTITLAAPGLRKAIPAAATNITIVGAAARNLAFTRNAFALAARLPALPPNGDLATDRASVIDVRSGLAFEIAYYPGFRMGGWFISLAWGVACMKPEHSALLLG